MGAALTQNGKCPCCSICLYKYYRVSMVYQIIIILITEYIQYSI